MEKRSVEQYRVFDLNIKGSKVGNPFKEAKLEAVFSNGTERYRVKGFYKGDGNYGIRFMPGSVGEWKYEIFGMDVDNERIVCTEDDKIGEEKNDENGERRSGSFLCTPASEKNHGRVLLAKNVYQKGEVNFYPTEDEYHFAYEDGTRYQPFGTTCYAWINQKEEIQEQTLETLKQAPFNKIRMCIFPKFYSYNTEDPEMYAFEGDAESGFDFERFNPKFFENLEKRINQLDELGIQADIILLHPYDRWGFSKMTREQDIFYLTYVVRRLSHFKNVWWSLANEYDLMPQKPVEDWETYAHVIMENDPYGHLRSIHNCIPFYDHSRPWVTHCSIQRIDVYKTAEMVTEWRKQYRKPVVIDECGYEGNIDFGWGNLTGEELTRRYWEGCVRGGYLSHGETYVDRGDQIWWSHGGTLTGDSVARIGFLKQILAETPVDAEPLELTPENHEENWDAPCMHLGDEFFLYYYGFSRPLYRNYTLPAGKKYKLELIDTWNMTIEELPEIYEGKIRIKMGARQYMAVRMKWVESENV